MHLYKTGSVPLKIKLKIAYYSEGKILFQAPRQKFLRSLTRPRSCTHGTHKYTDTISPPSGHVAPNPAQHKAFYFCDVFYSHQCYFTLKPLSL